MAAIKRMLIKMGKYTITNHCPYCKILIIENNQTERFCHCEKCGSMFNKKALPDIFIMADGKCIDNTT